MFSPGYFCAGRDLLAESRGFRDSGFWQRTGMPLFLFLFFFNVLMIVSSVAKLNYHANLFCRVQKVVQI